MMRWAARSRYRCRGRWSPNAPVPGASTTAFRDKSKQVFRDRHGRTLSLKIERDGCDYDEAV